jgi:hypothetical protein
MENSDDVVAAILAAVVMMKRAGTPDPKTAVQMWDGVRAAMREHRKAPKREG